MGNSLSTSKSYIGRTRSGSSSSSHGTLLARGKHDVFFFVMLVTAGHHDVREWKILFSDVRMNGRYDRIYVTLVSIRQILPNHASRYCSAALVELSSLHNGVILVLLRSSGMIPAVFLVASGVSSRRVG